MVTFFNPSQSLPHFEFQTDGHVGDRSRIFWWKVWFWVGVAEIAGVGIVGVHNNEEG